MNYAAALPEPEDIVINGIKLSTHVVDNGLWLFSNKQLAEALDVSLDTINSHFRRNRKILEEGVHWFDKKGNLPKGFPRLRLWTKEGFIEMALFVKTARAGRILDALGVAKYHQPRIESRYVEILKSALEGIIPFETQYSVANFRIDVYIPSLNLAIEIDEEGHKNYNNISDTLRAVVIASRQGCQFVRFNPHDPHKNVGHLINAILRHYLGQKLEE